MLEWAVEEYNGPVAVRYPRGGDRGYSGSAWKNQPDLMKNGALARHREGKDLTIITYGTLLENTMEAAEILASNGVEATVLRLLTVAPLPVDAVAESMADSDRVLIVEEAMTGCGIHEPLAWALRQKKPACRVDCLDLGSRFVTHGSLADLYHAYHLDAQSIADFVLEVHHNEN